eukprot:Blabericola_migrator_1__7678@NODE_391_length_9042_cov_77_341616_g312_i0_p4_GENE_NODE_391_length_9042_cov_77_341616_g312_i0NODE_391_length_9042_cov_77_341616_g312_i0_p4_ORF_typecomplete_len329_score21_96_NODE_391_length_9042_cov_77_341616_g312_i038064792
MIIELGWKEPQPCCEQIFFLAMNIPLNAASRIYQYLGLTDKWKFRSLSKALLDDKGLIAADIHFLVRLSHGHPDPFGQCNARFPQTKLPSLRVLAAAVAWWKGARLRLTHERLRLGVATDAVKESSWSYAVNQDLVPHVIRARYHSLKLARGVEGSCLSIEPHFHDCLALSWADLNQHVKLPHPSMRKCSMPHWILMRELRTLDLDSVISSVQLESEGENMRHHAACEEFLKSDLTRIVRMQRQKQLKAIQQAIAVRNRSLRSSEQMGKAHGHLRPIIDVLYHWMPPAIPFTWSAGIYILDLHTECYHCVAFEGKDGVAWIVFRGWIA